jgi:hypothetical protein
MFYFGNRYRYNSSKPELIKYIKESNEKSFEKFINYNKINIKKSDSNKLDFKKEELDLNNNNYFLLPIVSLFSFLAGYNFRSLLIKRI